MIATLPARLAAAVLLGFCSPILLLVGLAVRLGLGSPVLFRQCRAGLGGVSFEMMKFRTMADARDANGELLPDEERTPRLGRILRRSRLDELPELINIVRGDMAFVGPRPLLPHTVAAMGDEGIRRGAVAPGLTGLAQVSGNTLLTQEEKLAIDLAYVDRRDWRMDLLILLRTVWVVIGGERRTGQAYACNPRRSG
ncbi:sugar transferase [Novosphingobium sp. RD2P27]|uniref:Sugar transferase n=1 Tax=Novosphingobium kalidii TaxID=3230299 RepID=A0ABV2D490_9SPHN